MIITGIETVGKSRSRIYIDEQLAFVLYRGELSRYRIKLDKELSEENYREIMEKVLPKRAKLRCMNILKSYDKTESQLRQKLKDGQYPEAVIDEAIAYVKSFHYIDDVRYARQYMESRRRTKSFRQMQQELMQKGITKADIAQANAECEEVDEEEVIRKLAQKKRMNLDDPTYEERQKNFAFFMRKGFSASTIHKVLQTDTFT